MKLLFSLLFAAASFTASAQLLGPNTDKQIDESIRKRIEEGIAQQKSPSLPHFNTELPSRQKAGTAAGKSGVCALPQDAMPCVVPDTNSIAVIPNAAPTVHPYRKDMPTGPGSKGAAK